MKPLVFLKAAGIVLACILALIALLLIALLHFRFVFTLEGEPKAELRIFFIKINLLARREKKPKKPKKKPRRFAAYLKRKFGFEHPPEAPAPEGETVSAKAKKAKATSPHCTQSKSRRFAKSSASSLTFLSPSFFC